LVPGSNESILTIARNKVSWTIVGAIQLPDNDIANARRFGTVYVAHRATRLVT
jgi:hypothetical protein